MDTPHGLGRRAEFDEKSKNFPIRTLVGDRPPRSYTWACGVNLDQGNEGACVGFAWAQELAARPVVAPGVADGTAQYLYRRAQQLDEWDGEAYSGTSVLAGAKAVTEQHPLEYRWAFGEADLAVAVSYKGPAVIGVNWYSGMFGPEADGFLRVKGEIAGGHAILVRGYHTGWRRYLLHNSWGASWGGLGGAPPGCAWLSADDMARLLAEQGDACIPVKRR